MSSVDGLDIREIMSYIRHRYPMLLVDRVVELEAGVRARCIKCVTMNEPYFQGHFPDVPVMPGVLIIESLAQAAAVMVTVSLSERYRGHNIFFAAIKDAKFRHPVVPGDVLDLRVEALQRSERRGNLFWRVSGAAYVGERCVAEADMTALIEG